MLNIVSGNGTSDDPCTEIYPGPGAFSEKEVRAVANFVSENDVVLYMAYHNCAQFYMTPYGFTFDEPPDYDGLVRERVSGLFLLSQSNCRNATLGYFLLTISNTFNIDF